MGKVYIAGKLNGTVRDYQPAVRRCLGPGCTVSFRSQGPGHRVCARCRKRTENLSKRLNEPACHDARGDR
jgi:hypothetical protein